MAPKILKSIILCPSLSDPCVKVGFINGLPFSRGACAFCSVWSLKSCTGSGRYQSYHVLLVTWGQTDIDVEFICYGYRLHIPVQSCTNVRMHVEHTHLHTFLCAVGLHVYIYI